MAHGFEVTIDEMRRAAAAAREVAEIADDVKLAEAVTGAGSAMPGSHTASGTPRLATAWREQLVAWGDEADRYADNLIAAADLYSREDARAVADLGHLPWVEIGPWW